MTTVFTVTASCSEGCVVLRTTDKAEAVAYGIAHPGVILDAWPSRTPEAEAKVLAGSVGCTCEDGGDGRYPD